MKKSLSILTGVVSGLLVSASVLAGAAYTQEFKAGTYKGSFQSVAPELNGTACTADVKNAASNVEATITCANGTKEIWSWNDKTLTQKEFDAAKGDYAAPYAATGTKAAVTNEQVFAVNKDAAKGTCDAGVDCRTTWTVRATPTGFDYVVYGPQNKADAASPVVQRHLISFTTAK